MSKRALGFAIVLTVVAAIAAAGYWLYGRPSATTAPETALEHARKHLDPTYTCPMHPQVKSDKPGNCPICGMPLVKVKDERSGERKILYWHDPMYPQQKFDKPGKSPFMDMELVPVYEDDAGDDGSISINPRVVQNIGVRLAPVEAVNFARRVDTVGTVMFDERRIEVVESRAAGWVERLHVRAENDPVRRGQLLAEVYAPDLFAAQEEFVLALKNAGSGDDPLVRAARARLSFLGLSAAQIAELENTREPRRRIAFYSPISGIVAELGVRQGMQVGPGIKLFEIVDLSTVWITAEIVENQAAWITEGKKVEARVAALPGKVLEGKVEYVYPELMRETRTLMARVSVKNPGLQLKPGMFAELALYAGEKHNTLAVPTEAVIQTGTRTVVIVAEGEGKFRPVAVLTGLESEGKTEILKGLEQGQQVVASGQFLIDSEASLRTALERLKEPEPQVQPLQKEGTLRYKSNPTVTGK